MRYYIPHFASTYGEGVYNTNLYGSQTTTGGGGSTGGGTTTGTGSGGAGGNSSGGILTNTGFDVIAAVTLACVIIFAALIVRFWKRPAKAETQNQ